MFPIILLMCCLSASLLISAFVTEYWFYSDSKWSAEGDKVSGHVHFGLFKGMNRFTINQYRTHTLYVVCLESKCMYSCGTNKEYREQQLQMLLDGETEGLTDHCSSTVDTETGPLMMVDLTQTQLRGDVDDLRKTHLKTLFSPTASYVEMAFRNENSTATPLPDELEYMDYGLWVGTIACLSVGLLMAVVGALFAVVNTATTPVEAITGVPGLYLWNGLAAIFDMITVILWAVQFHKHLTSNVLLYDASAGWSTEGMEVFGYSFWLVVVAIFVHVANIVIIAIGTWEPKQKGQIQTPDSKGGGLIMLY